MQKILSIFILSLMLISFTSAWDTCDLGCTEDSAACGAYVDTNNDDFCDHGQTNPSQIPSAAEETSLSIPIVLEDTHDLISGQELKTKTVKEIANIYEISEIQYTEKLSEELKIKVSPNHNFQTLYNNYKLDPSTAKEITLELESLNPIMKEVNYEGKDYHTIPIISTTILLYFLSLFLVKRKKLLLRNHRKIWNILLLAAFLGTGLLGLLLTINLEFGLGIILPFNMLKWHVLIGIPSVVISFFHIFWHMPYLKKILNFN